MSSSGSRRCHEGTWCVHAPSPARPPTQRLTKAHLTQEPAPHEPLAERPATYLVGGEASLEEEDEEYRRIWNLPAPPLARGGPNEDDRALAALAPCQQLAGARPALQPRPDPDPDPDPQLTLTLIVIPTLTLTLRRSLSLRLRGAGAACRASGVR